MTTLIITPVLSSPPPLVSTENIICYMDTTEHLSICMLITNQFLQINNRVDMYIHKFIIYTIKLQHIWLHILLLCNTEADKDASFMHDI